MKLNMKTYAMLMGFLIASHNVSANPTTLTFKNEYGSNLELHVENQKALTGTFTTAVASKECQEVIGQKRPIIGYIDGTAITFSVNYPSCGSILTFTGHINQKRDTIKAISIVAHQMKSFTQGPGSQFIGQNTFVKTKG